MCGGRPRVDTSLQDQMRADAERARADEEARQERIRTGSAEIDRVFGGFDDSFFNEYRDNFTSLYLPELNDQFSNAQDRLTYALADAGTLKSSMAGDKLGDLMKQYEAAKTGVVADATGAAADLRGRVNNEKSSLVSLLNATGDANRATNEALARSQTLFQEGPRYNPLGDVFGGVAAGVGNIYARRQQEAIRDAYFGRGTNSSSGRVVN